MTTRRLSRIFKPDGRALIVALDHGLTDGPIRGLEQLETTIAAVVAGGADAVLASYGTATRFAPALAPVGLILRLDGGTTVVNTNTPAGEFYSVADALRLGADAVVASAFPGTPQEALTLRHMAATIAEAHRWGMPVMGEMAPGGFDSGPEFHTTEVTAIAARTAAELGADWLKLPYADDYRRVVASCYVPILILGGVKAGSPRDLLTTVHQALQAGAAGVAMGRNIFQSADPRAMTRALAAIIHQGATVDEALAIASNHDNQ